MVPWVFITIAFSSVLSGCHSNPDDMSTLIEVTPRTEREVKNLVIFMTSSYRSKVDLLNQFPKIGEPAQFRVESGYLRAVVRKLRSLVSQVKRKDLSRMLKESAKELHLDRRNTTSFKKAVVTRFGLKLDRFNSYAEIQPYLLQLAKKYSTIANSFVLGKTHEGRDIVGLRVGEWKAGKRIVWIDGGFHAREWISPSSVLYFLTTLLKNSQTQKIKTILKKVVFFVIPVSNPDGYEYTWENPADGNHRLWRKNRSSNPGSRCIGTDLNRNFAQTWGGLGSSSDPCSIVYHGSNRFSEKETRASARSILRQKKFLKPFFYLTVHSFGQLLLHGWGWQTKTYPKNLDKILKVGEAAAAGIRSVRGTNYRVGPSAELLYPAAGCSDDWAGRQAKFPYFFTAELSPSDASEVESRDGFIVSQKWILPVAQELYQGIIRAVEVALKI